MRTEEEEVQVADPESTTEDVEEEVVQVWNLRQFTVLF